MSQIFLFGASSVYGIGGEDGGWGDLTKRALHAQMFGDGGAGESHELYNFGKPGATTEFVLNNFEAQLQQYARTKNLIAVVSVGTNNARAQDSPNNYVSTLADYETAMRKLLVALTSKIPHVICVGYRPVDESKTTPKSDPITGGTAYFMNNRIQEFNKSFSAISKETGATFIGLDVPPETWIAEYVYKDGLHPNKRGHQLIFEKVWPEIEKLLV
jgi:lysophospholipase L1-like esterase